MFAQTTEAVLTHPDVADLINNDEEHFDLAIIETFFPTSVVFAQRFKCPFIGVHSNHAFGYLHHILGNPVHPVMYPDALIPYEEDTDLLTRLRNTVIMSAINVFVKYVIIPLQDQLVRKYFGESYPTLEDILRNISLQFIVGDSFLQNVRPLGPNTIYIGGTSHIEKPKPLPQDLQEFLDDAKEGAIYFSLGSNVRSKDIPKEQRKIIIDVFSKLPHKVVWKFEADQLENKPDSVKIIKWAPQHDILNHPNVKLLITQGRLQSLQESVFFHVPMLVIPFMGDQASNAKRIVKQGLGLTLNLKTMTLETFKAAILEIINNDKYTKRVTEFSQLIQDQPIVGLDKAVWWTEYVIRNKGAEVLRNPAANTPFYQYYLLDVIAALSLLIIAVIYTVQRIVRFILRGFCIFIAGKRKIKMS